jgi:DNA (cytosine-5)-methyltransferase 1
MKHDIKNLHSNAILEVLEGRIPDLILASPPCEAFSSANVSRKKNEYDRLYSNPTGRSLLHAIRLIIDLNPKYFFIENVRQVATRKLQRYIRNEFRPSDYPEIHFNLLESLDYEVPSARKRVFISNLEVPYQKTKKGRFTVNSAFKGLPNPHSLNDLPNHEILHPSRSVAKKIHKTPPNGALVYFQGSGTKTFRNYQRLEKDSPAPTIMGKSRFIHPVLHRLCTVREHARLMSYPDEFQFLGPQERQYNQVGESVPPLLSKGIAEYLIKNNP